VSAKLRSLADAAALIRDGVIVALGGSLLHRTPAAFARELARQGRRDLTFIKPSAAYDLDLLCATGCVTRVEAGIVTCEPPFGLTPNQGHKHRRQPPPNWPHWRTLIVNGCATWSGSALIATTRAGARVRRVRPCGAARLQAR
jgi:hypothetical protein